MDGLSADEWSLRKEIQSLDRLATRMGRQAEEPRELWATYLFNLTLAFKKQELAAIRENRTPTPFLRARQSSSGTESATG